MEAGRKEGGKEGEKWEGKEERRGKRDLQCSVTKAL